VRRHADGHGALVDDFQRRAAREPVGLDRLGFRRPRAADGVVEDHEAVPVREQRLHFDAVDGRRNPVEHVRRAEHRIADRLGFGVGRPVSRRLADLVGDERHRFGLGQREPALPAPAGQLGGEEQQQGALLRRAAGASAPNPRGAGPAARDAGPGRAARATHVVALRVVHAVVAQEPHGGLVLDELGDRLLAEAARDLDDRLDGQLVGGERGSSLTKSPSIFTQSNGRCLR
jgi:hypothetical protein